MGTTSVGDLLYDDGWPSLVLVRPQPPHVGGLLRRSSIVEFDLESLAHGGALPLGMIMARLGVHNGFRPGPPDGNADRFVEKETDREGKAWQGTFASRRAGNMSDHQEGTVVARRGWKRKRGTALFES
jgi:hypothetical protein